MRRLNQGLSSKRIRCDPDFFYVFNIILSFSTCSQSFKKICTVEILGANVLKILITLGRCNLNYGQS